MSKYIDISNQYENVLADTVKLTGQKTDPQSHLQRFDNILPRLAVAVLFNRPTLRISQPCDEQDKFLGDLTLHNVLLGHYVFLPTEKAKTYLEIYVLTYHSTYICPRRFGWKENLIFKEIFGLRPSKALGDSLRLVSIANAEKKMLSKGKPSP